MHYEGNVIRPPSEANSVILQVTVGCSHNKCTFCGAYRGKRFRIKENSIVNEDIQFAARYCQRQKTLFLADGNVLVMPQKDLVGLLKKIKTELPFIRRVSLYANARDIIRRTTDELLELKKLGLGRIYMGLESGHEPTLQAIEKGESVDNIILSGQHVRDAGIFLSVTILLGLGGIKNSDEHARATAAALNEMQPSQIAVLTLMVLENTPLADQIKTGVFEMPGTGIMFKELHTLIENLDQKRAQFQANHASNYFSLDGRLPKDKEKFLSLVNQALSGKIALKSEYSRAL